MPTKTNRISVYLNRQGKDWTDLTGEPHRWTTDDSLSLSYENSVSFGENLSDWKGRIRAHKNATTLLSGLRRTTTQSSDGYAFCRATFGAGVRNGELRGCLVDFDLASPSDPSAFEIVHVRNEVIQSINSQIRGATKSLQGLVALGEMGETVRMLNSLGKGFFGKTENYLRDLSKVAGRLTPQNLARTVSEKWLEYRFGVRPLVSDIGDFVEACYQSRYGRPPVIHVRKSSKSEEKVNPSPTSSKGAHYHLIKTTAEKSWVYGYRIYGVVGLTDNTVPPFRTEFGLTLDEFIPTLWELVPYSFLVDYTTNIGAIIDGYSLNKSNVLWLAYGDLRESKVTLTATVTPSFVPGWKVVSSVSRPCTPLTRTWRHVNRGIYSQSSLIPSLEFKIPGCDTQWLNIGALATLHADASRRLRARARI
jgi:hypothetical protein